MQTREAVAIVGIGCRFPGGAHGPQKFWDLIAAGTDLTSELPEDRYSRRRFYDPNPKKPGRMHTMHGGFLDSIDRFDHAFFGISPREADYLDPQQRLLLETTWEAFEDGGLLPADYAGTPVGVFIGAFTLDYKILQFGGHRLDNVGVHTATGSMMTMVSNRISYVFDFLGPSLSIDTACSSSLVATHYARESLLSGECDTALAGGVMLMSTPHYTLAEAKGGFLSPDGRCKTFDASANGYARGEGVGLVVLKRLSDAVAADDRIYAVIRATGVNQDGRTAGITVPNGDQQIRLLEKIYGEAGIDPGNVGYVEAHGTGTPVGDPIEANSLGHFFSRNRSPNNPCTVGSVKTNIGHLESAAGIAGLVKTALCLHQRRIPPHLNLVTPSPKIDFSALGLRLPTRLERWPDNQPTAIAGVNSFGFGGTNAHCVLEAYRPKRGTPLPIPAGSAASGGNEKPAPLVVPLSARTEEGLDRVAERIGDWIEHESGTTAFADFVSNMARRRSHHEYRMGVVARGFSELRERLQGYLAGELDESLVSGRARSEERPARLCFVYTGNGPQWWAMGQELYAAEPVFRDAVDRVASAFSQYADWSLLEEMSRFEADHRMGETQIAQPANFAIQYALSELYSSWGIEPDAVVGHSTGEAGAFFKAGVLPLEEAVHVIYHRSRLQQLTAGSGTLLATGLTRDQAKRLLIDYPDRVSIAGCNAPGSTTLAGDYEAIAEIADRLKTDAVFCKQLRVDCPFHSHLMEGIREELLEQLAGIRPRTATLPLYAAATAKRATGPELDADYWWRNVREPVLFQDCFSLAVEDGCTAFLEIGPHPVLAASIKECAAALDRPVDLFHSLYRGKAETETIQRAVAGIHTLGFGPDFSRLHPAGRLVDLPLYPFAQDVCWAESPQNQAFRIGKDDHPLLGRRLATASPIWEAEISGHWNRFLLDHRIQGNCLFPGAGYLEQAAAAARQATAGSHFALERIELRKALFLPQDSDPKVQVQLADEAASFVIAKVPDQDGETAVVLAQGELRQLQPLCTRRPTDIEALQARCPRGYRGPELYAELTAMGFEYGPAFQGIAELALGELESLARIEQPADIDLDDPDWIFHPVAMDAAFQALIAVELMKPNAEEREIRLPVAIERVVFHGPARPLMWAHARVVSRTEQETVGEIAIYDETGKLVANVEGFRARTVAQESGTATRQSIASWLYQVAWEDRALETKEEQAAKSSPLLLLAPDGSDGTRLADEFLARGVELVEIRKGRTFRWDSDTGRGTLDPHRKEDYRSLRSALEAVGKLPARVVHAWSLDAPPIADSTSELLDTRGPALARGALHLCQALAEDFPQAKLWLLTRGAQSGARDAGPVDPHQATVWGLGRVFGQQEHVGQWGGAIDLDPRGNANEMTAAVDEVLAASDEDQVMLRGPDSRRSVMRIRRMEGLYRTLQTRFRSDGAYLVTGAFGALGRLTAQWLADRGATLLILVGRSPLPPREEWEQIGPEDPDHARIAFVERLERQGVRLLCHAIDCARADQVSRFLSDLRATERSPIRGLFHCAGLVRDSILTHMNEQELLDVLRPKVQGAWNLHHLLRDEPLEHFVLYSSVASLVTSTGQASYAAGNAFLDALAHRRRLSGLPGLSINWGPWETGMVSDLDLVDHYRRRGMPPISPDAGICALETAVVQDCSQIVIAEADWPRVLEYYPRSPASFAHLAREGAIADDEGEVDPRRRIEAASERDRLAVAVDELTNLVVRVLRIRKTAIEPGMRLSSVGVDSMLATELRNRIELTLGGSLTVVDLLGDATLEQLAAKLIADLAEQAPEQRETNDEELAKLLVGDPSLAATLLDEIERMSSEDARRQIGDPERSEPLAAE